MESIFTKISELEGSNKNAALCIIIETSGSTPRKQGSKMLVFEDGQLFGTIGGGALEKQVILNAILAIKNNKAEVYTHHLEKEHNMTCGGKVDIYIEPIQKKKKLIIFGGGHIGKILAEFSKKCDFDITIVDEREEIFNNWDTGNYTIINKNLKLAFDEIPFDENTFITVMTHKHDYDHEIVAYTAKQPHYYLGMIGSKRKIEKLTAIFLNEKILSKEQIARIDWPIGIQIDVQTPEEIAVSILAKIIDVRSGMK